MIAAAHRFHGHASLRFVYQTGRLVRSNQSAALGLKYAVNPRRTSYRAAVVISKKVHKSAVVRNRIRRRVYEQVRLQMADSAQPYDLVLTVFQPEITDLTSGQLSSLVADLLQKAGIIQKKTS